MKTLINVKDFILFFQEVTGHDPYPWQMRYAERLCEKGWDSGKMWEDVAVATSAGKTKGVVLAWLFALAYRRDRNLGGVPRRLYWTVDRRRVVDDVHELGVTLEDALSRPEPEPGSVCSRVAQALLPAVGGSKPFQAVRMRGGVATGTSWMEDPRVPSLISTTVDQVGSGLLFRKYGSRNRMWSVFAGVCSLDSAIVMDEIHISQPFVDTLECAKEMCGLDIPLVGVSATPRNGSLSLLSQEDIDHPALGRRLGLSKVAKLVPISKNSQLISKMVQEAKGTVGKTPKVVAVVCNTVKLAREVYEALAKVKKADAILVTGRSRQIDRDAIMETAGPFLAAREDRPTPEKTLFVVATQCLEVGADFDFDIMITECAPVDALIQRTGRLGRTGTRKVKLVIVQTMSDPVYGGASIKTWEWLCSLSKVDFSWRSQSTFGDALVELKSPSDHAPLMTPDVVEDLSETCPPRQNAPTLERFLHGYQRSPNVTLIYRGDLPENVSLWAETVALCPPASGEALEIPIWTALELLGGDPKGKDVSDVSSPAPKDPSHTKCAPVLRWEGTPEDSAVLRNTRRIRPGDVLVVPLVTGGCDEYGWTPDKEAVPEDVADRCRHHSRRGVLRLHPALISGLDLEEEVREGGITQELLRELLEKHPQGDLLKDAPRLGYTPYPDGRGVVVYLPKDRPQPLSDEEDTSSITPTEDLVLLNDHLVDTGKWAKVYAEDIFGDPDLAEVFRVAGVLHDIGKSNPGWQMFIYGGAWTTDSPPVAKPPGATDLRLLKRGYRHEFGSVAMMDTVDEVREVLKESPCPELSRYLVAVHHGLGRPFVPALHDQNPRPYKHELHTGVEVTVPSTSYEYDRADGGWADDWHEQNRKRGRWSLAQMEAVFRMADWRASSEAMKGNRDA